MHGYWTTSTKLHFLHDAWHLGTETGIAIAMAISAILSFVYEFLDLIYYRIITTMRQTENNFQQSTACNPIVLPRRCIGSLLYIIRVINGYILMLCVMTMNVWIFVSVLVGTMLGFFIKYYFRGKISSKSKEEAKIKEAQPEQRPNCHNTSNEAETLLLQNIPCGGSKSKKNKTGHKISQV
ncbi:protein SLC31A2-like [Saccostrea echinata]|uniref:protein SLC31A2-like n=1 Tax=Saccostrea echinata TaxID=191078 RepID=UPI002A802B98|nr:protein SLC31A2-like [Saccostrea echinata]